MPNYNKEGVYRAQHNAKLQDIAKFYVDMCIFAGLSEPQLIKQLFARLRVTAYEEKVKLLNPNRFKAPKGKAGIKETLLYNLFLCYCLLELVAIDSEFYEFADCCVKNDSGKNFGDLSELQQFDEFVTENFFPLYDAKIHNAMQDLTKFKTDTNNYRVMRKSESGYPLLIVADIAPFVFAPKKYEYKPKKR